MKELAILCKKCGYKNDRGEKICANCGTRLEYTAPLAETIVMPQRDSYKGQSPQSGPPDGFTEPRRESGSVQPEYFSNQPGGNFLPDQPQFWEKQNKRGGKRLFWVLGIIVLGCVGVIFLGFVIIRGFNLHTKTPGQMTVNSGGGTFQNQNVMITFPPNDSLSPVDLKITQSQTSSSESTQDPQIEIEGRLAEINAVMTITMPIPAAWLTTDGQIPEDQEIIIVLEEEVYSTSAGTFRSKHPIPSSTELKTRTITAQIPFGSDLDSKTSVPHNARLLPQKTADVQKIVVAVNMRGRGGEFKVYGCQDPSKAFSIESNQETPAQIAPFLSDNDCKRLVKILQAEKNKLETLGFKDFFTEHEKPIRVYLDSQMTEFQYGKGTISSLGNYKNSYLIINSRYAVSGQEEQFKATSGHELFHLVQYSYNPLIRKTRYSNIKFEPERDHLKTLWSDEALAVWFEADAMDTPDEVPGLALSYMRELITLPLFVPQSRQASQEKGYGASFFLRYLTNKYGVGLVKEILAAQLDQDVDTGISMLAWSHAVGLHNNFIEEDWIYFLETFLINPKALKYKTLVTSDLTTDTQIALESDVDVDMDESKGWYEKSYATFNDVEDAKKLISGVQRGYVTRPTIPAHVQLKIPLKNFSSKPIRLIIKDTGASFTIIPGKLLIKVTCQSGSQSLQACPKEIGLLIYPVQTGAKYGTVSNALSPADNFIWPAGTNLVEWPSIVFAPNKNIAFNSLVLIPFNAYAATYEDSTNVIIDAYYYWNWDEYKEQFPDINLDSETPKVTPTKKEATATSTATPDIQKPTEIDPVTACKCEDEYLDTVYRREDLESAKWDYGDKLISEDLEWVTRVYYDTETNKCRGYYRIARCVKGYDPECFHPVEGWTVDVSVDVGRDRCRELQKK